MELTEVMKKRKSVRRYSGEAIPQEKLDKVLLAGTLAPTSRNLKPCQFHLIRDKELLKQLSAAKKAGAAFVKDADAVIVVSADSMKSDTWIEDSSIAMTYMMLGAEEQNVGCCWVQIHLRKNESDEDAEEIVKELLHLSEHHRVVGLLSLGIPETGEKS